MRILCSTGAVTRHPTRADHRLIADARGLPCDGFELSIYSSWVDDVDPNGDAIRLAEIADGLRALHSRHGS